MGKGTKKRGHRNRKSLKPPPAAPQKPSIKSPTKTEATSPIPAEVPPPTKTKFAPPQPNQRYRDPVDTDSDEMSENDCDSLTQLSLASSTSSRAQVELTVAQLQSSQNYFAGLENSQDPHPMETDDLTIPTSDQHAHKRKRADTNPEDQGTPSPAMRSTKSQSNHPLPPNQLGLSTSSRTQTPPSTTSSPAAENTQLSRLSLGSNLSTAALRNDTVPSPGRQSQSNQPQYPPSQPPRSRVTINTRVVNLEITGFLGENPLIGINPPSAAGWKSIGDLKALIYPHDASFVEEEKGVVTESMILVVALHLNCHRPIVTTPKQAKEFKKRKPANRRPWVFMITGLSEENLNTILANRFISNQHATLHVLPFDPPPSHYIGRIKNLTHDTDRQDSVICLIQNSIDTDSTVKSFIEEFIRTHNDNLPRSVLRKSYPLDWILSTVRAFPIQSEKKHGKPYSQWNWYIFTPTRIQEHVDEWIKTLATVQFDAITLGVGETITNLKCTRCKSTNHINSECPFTGRTPFVPTLTAPTNNAPSTSRGGRGGGKRGQTRGRGRG
ncbi:hypothetical protein BJ322DRAFT_1022413 [Thelephora terrestris]|uniref:Uncharacterized protein n=1 Tax=Thelephora terrestris TaxID=56493 RepID=A0A9P6L5A2_9AGAM|nr:hypothetical protein BJ322DRAFT_1022413 [Thelephora terrestris]